MKIIQSYSSGTLTWFRIFGYGLCFRDTSVEGFSLSFSERNGYKKYVEAFGFVITTLKPNK